MATAWPWPISWIRTLADNDTTVLAGKPPGTAVQTLALVAGSPAIDAAPSSHVRRRR